LFSLYFIVTCRKRCWTRSIYKPNV